jgi:hypothetical protein
VPEIAEAVLSLAKLSFVVSGLLLKELLGASAAMDAHVRVEIAF